MTKPRTDPAEKLATVCVTLPTALDGIDHAVTYPMTRDEAHRVMGFVVDAIFGLPSTTDWRQPR